MLRFIQEDTCHKYLVNTFAHVWYAYFFTFLHIYSSVLHVFRQFSLTFTCNDKLALRKFTQSNDKMGKDTFISLAYFLLSKKKHLFCKLDLFSQNTDIVHFPEDFCRYQRTTNE